MEKKTVLPKVQVNYSDGKGDFSTSLYYGYANSPAPITDGTAPIKCSVVIENEKVVTDVRLLVTSLVGFLNLTQPQQKPMSFETTLSKDGILLALTERQCELLLQAVSSEIDNLKEEDDSTPLVAELCLLSSFIEDNLFSQGE